MIKKAKKILKTVFGYDEFRPMQKEIVQAVLDKKDCLVLMPTGGGKSLCFQLPAITMPGMAVVVSPLISLMRDQVVGLKANGVKAEYLNSSLDYNEQDEIKARAKNGDIDLLYISPEKVVQYDMTNFLKTCDINLIAIDEAHCVSSWGHDFRPEYARLGQLKSMFTDIPFIALTATADSTTKRDIIKQLALQDYKIFLSSFDRPNLRLEVRPGRKRIEQIVEYAKDHNKESGIIYCLSKKSCEKVAEKLRSAGLSAEHYHAGLTPKQRNTKQDAFIYGKIDVIVATIAFGMGIDKSNVRYVIHYNLPKNVEGYYQEIGRAGRDGLASDTILFYSFADIISLQKMIETSQQKHVQLAKLERMQQYADAIQCRRKILLGYFHEEFKEDCGNCDICEHPPEVFDGTVLAQKALSAIVRLGQQVGSGMVIDVLRGSSRFDITTRGFDKIKTYGAGKDVSVADWQQYFLQMLNLGLFGVNYQNMNVLYITELGKEVLLGNKKIQLVSPALVEERAAARKKKVFNKHKVEGVHDELFEHLREIRKEIATELQLPSYLVFNDATLAQMAAIKPSNDKEFLTVSGVGEKKLVSFGSQFLMAIRDFEG